MRSFRWPTAVFEIGRSFPGRSALKGEEADAAPAVKGWQKGKGWGWIWGAEDEVGSLNAMTPATVKSALQLAKEAKSTTWASPTIATPSNGPATVRGKS